MRPRKAVAIITPNESLREQYRLQLDVWGYRVYAPEGIDQAFAIVEALRPDAVVCDRMADEAVRELAAVAPVETSFVIISEGGQAAWTLNRKAPGFNALLRERLQIAVARKCGTKKASGSAHEPIGRKGKFACLALAVLLMSGLPGTLRTTLEQCVRSAEIHLSHSVASQFAAQRAGDNDGRGGKGIDSGRHLATASLAADHVHGVPDAVAVVTAVVHAHACTISESKAKTPTAHLLVQTHHNGLWFRLERAA